MLRVWLLLVFTLTPTVANLGRGREHAVVGEKALDTLRELSPILFVPQTEEELKQSVDIVQSRKLELLRLGEALGKNPYLKELSLTLAKYPTTFIGLSHSKLSHNIMKLVDSQLPGNNRVPQSEGEASFTPEKYPFLFDLMKHASQEAIDIDEQAWLQVSESETDPSKTSMNLTRPTSVSGLMGSIPSTGYRMLDMYINAWVVCVLLFASGMAMVVLVMLFTVIRAAMNGFRKSEGTQWHIHGLYLLPSMFYSALCAIGLAAIYLGLGYVAMSLANLDLKDHDQRARSIVEAISSFVQRFLQGMTTFQDKMERLSSDSKGLWNELASIPESLARLDTVLKRLFTSSAALARAVSSTRNHIARPLVFSPVPMRTTLPGTASVGSQSKAAPAVNVQRPTPTTSNTPPNQQDKVVREQLLGIARQLGVPAEGLIGGVNTPAQPLLPFWPTNTPYRLAR